MKIKYLSTGNEACGEGAIRAGCRFYAGYPITPQNELIAYVSRRMEEESGIFIQAESELAAVNMVLGASAAGARAMTSSSSPGISLKLEGISYMAGSELPAVIVNVMRGGPGLGNISPSQADYSQATKGGGHGDYRIIVTSPATVQETFDLTYQAFALADKYRIPVMILTDGMLGQMMEPLEFDEGIKPPPEVAKPWAMTGAKGRAAQSVKSLFLGDGVLELFEYYEPVGTNKARSMGQYDHGIVHIGFEVDDFHVRMEHLRKNNVKFLGEPVEFRPGVWVLYFFGPDGEACELHDVSASKQK